MRDNSWLAFKSRYRKSEFLAWQMPGSPTTQPNDRYLQKRNRKALV
jgi:hypothetical protein